MYECHQPPNLTFYELVDSKLASIQTFMCVIILIPHNQFPLVERTFLQSTALICRCILSSYN